MKAPNKENNEDSFRNTSGPKTTDERTRGKMNMGSKSPKKSDIMSKQSDKHMIIDGVFAAKESHEAVEDTYSQIYAKYTAKYTQIYSE